MKKIKPKLGDKKYVFKIKLLLKNIYEPKNRVGNFKIGA